MNGTDTKSPMRWPTKSPGADLDYTYDASKDLAGLDDTILMVSASIKPSGAGELSILAVTYVPFSITVWLSGGVPGRPYIIRATATTLNGRIFEWLFEIHIDATLAAQPTPPVPSEDFGPVSTWTTGAAPPPAPIYLVSTFVFHQVAPLATWVIRHGLYRYPAVAVVDSSGQVVEGDVEYDSSNQITLSFAHAFAGTAYLN